MCRVSEDETAYFQKKRLRGLALWAGPPRHFEVIRLALALVHFGTGIGRFRSSLRLLQSWQTGL